MTNCGCLRKSADPGLMPKRVPRAPAYSRFLLVADADVREQAASSDWWIASASISPSPTWTVPR